MKSIPKISFNKKSKEQIKGFELKVLEDFLSDLKKPIGHNPFQPHRLNFNIILIITEGIVRHSIDFESHDLGPGDVMVISKGQIHAFNKNSSYKGFMILFTEEFMQKYMASSTIAKINHLFNYFLGQEKLNNLEDNHTLLLSLQAEITRNTSSLPHIAGAFLSIYLLKLNEIKVHFTVTANCKELDYFNHFKYLVERNLSKTRDAKDYASDLSITYKQLNNACKEVVKSTAKSFIDSYVILESKRLLVTSTLSIKEIAFDLGFDEVTNFTKFFKKHTLTTPSKFRQE